MKRAAMYRANMCIALLLPAMLAACGAGDDPDPRQYGANPPLPEREGGLLPSMQIARPEKWGERTPTVPSGYAITAIATGLKIPRQTLLLPNGDILVAEGHGNAAPANGRLVRFDRTGKFLREYGKLGSGPEGEFMQPHGLAFDSKGRLFVADRSNNRIQVLDPETYKTLDTWYQFSRLSGIFIDTRTDTLYGADSESGSVSPPHYQWKRGIRIGSARDGKVTGFIPDPSHNGLTYEMVDGKVVAKMADGSKPPGGTLAAEGVAADSQGVIYGAEVGPRKLQRYVKK